MTIEQSVERRRHAEELLELGRQALEAGCCFAALTSAELAMAHWPVSPVAEAARRLAFDALSTGRRREVNTTDTPNRV